MASQQATLVTKIKRAEGAPRGSLSREGWLVGFIALILVAEVVLRIPAVTALLPDPTPRLWHALLVQEKLDYLAEMEAQQGVDLLFIGNSTTQAGINPQAFDTARGADSTTQPGSFNAAIEGLPPFGIEMFLPIFLKRAQPKTIVYGVSAQDLNSGSPWASDVTERVNHSPLALAESGKGIRGPFLAWLLKISQLYRYRPILLQTLISGGKAESHLEEIFFDERGHDAIARTLSDVPPNDRGYLYNKAGVLNYRADGLQADSLVHIIKQTQALGIELILVNMPLADDYYDNFDDVDDYQRYRTTISAIAQTYSIPFWDMEALASEASDFETSGFETSGFETSDANNGTDFGADFGDAEFADFNHLNDAGAIRLSRILAQLYVSK